MLGGSSMYEASCTDRGAHQHVDCELQAVVYVGRLTLLSLIGETVQVDLDGTAQNRRISRHAPPIRKVGACAAIGSGWRPLRRQH
jgi:hypothetical protein